MDARLALRPEEERRAASILKENYTWQYDADTIKQAKSNVAELLGEKEVVSKKRQSVRQDLKRAQEKVHEREQARQGLPMRKKKEKDRER